MQTIERKKEAQGKDKTIMYVSWGNNEISSNGRGSISNIGRKVLAFITWKVKFGVDTIYVDNPFSPFYTTFTYVRMQSGMMMMHIVSLRQEYFQYVFALVSWSCMCMLYS